MHATLVRYLQRTRARACLAILAVLGLMLAACASPRPPRSASPEPSRAEETFQRALASLSTDPRAAEQLLRESLEHDRFHAGAQNNLGVLLLQRGDLAQAATAFDQAATLMPSNPVPRLNLGVVYERAGRLDDAHQAFKAAVEVAPDHFESVQALTRLDVALLRIDLATTDRLAAIALRGTTPAWRTWAREKLALHGRKR